MNTVFLFPWCVVSMGAPGMGGVQLQLYGFFLDRRREQTRDTTTSGEGAGGQGGGSEGGEGSVRLVRMDTCPTCLRAKSFEDCTKSKTCLHNTLRRYTRIQARRPSDEIVTWRLRPEYQHSLDVASTARIINRLSRVKYMYVWPQEGYRQARSEEASSWGMHW